MILLFLYSGFDALMKIKIDGNGGITECSLTNGGNNGI